MKKNVLILFLVLLVMLAGCKSDDAPAVQPATDPASAAATTPAETVPSPTTQPTTAPTETVAPTTEPTVPPTTEPAPPPTTAPAIVITKHPTSETVSVGARTWFIAKAENETQITWEFFSPDGTMYSLQQAQSAHPGLILEVLPEDTLGLRQIPTSFNGWSARARYDGPGGTATTDRATITVRNPYADIIETYRSVHRTGTGNIEKGISELVNTHDYLGYAMKDLDGNGVQELILASDGNNLYPYVIYEIYTMENGQAVCMTKSAARSRYFMLRNGKLLLEGSNSAVSSTWVLYELNGDFYGVSEQIWTSDVPHDLADFAPYYYYSLPYGQGDPIVYDEAARLIESWEREIYLPDLTPII
jgi:hypothetical protein